MKRLYTGKYRKFMARGKMLFTILVVCVVVAVGCATDKRSAELIAYAEEIAMELPDSALRVVQSIDPESVRGRHDRAHYKLVVAEAHYHCDLIPNRDSIAQPLFDYYIGSDNHAERARALYQHALVMQAEGENARAMFSLLEAEKSLTHLDNPRLSGLIYLTKGEIYGAECLHKNALEEYQKSVSFFEDANLQEHSLYSKYLVAYSYAELRNFDTAIKLFQDLEREVVEAKYYLLQNDILCRLCFIYIELNDFIRCAEAYNRFKEFSDNTMYHYYCIGAILNAYNGNFEQSNILYSCAEKESISNPTLLKYTKCQILKHKGEFHKALNTYIECIDLQDQNVLIAINDSVLYDEIDFIESELAHNISIQKRNRVISALSIALLTAACILIAVIFLNRQRKYQAEIEQYISTIKELQMTTKDLPSQMNDSIDKLFKSRFKELNDLYDIYYDSVGSTRQMKIVFEQINNTINSIKCDKKRLAELEKIVNEYRGNMMSKLLDLCPNLNERQRKIALFSYAGFSLRAIALFMDSNPTQISKDKYKIKGIIKSCGDTKDSELLINSL